MELPLVTILLLAAAALAVGSEVSLESDASAGGGNVLRCLQSATLSKKTTWSPCDESTWQEPVLCESDGSHRARCVAAVDLRDHRVSRGCMNHKDADFLYMYSSPKEQAGQCRVSRGTVYCFCDSDECNDHQLIVNHQCFHCGRKGLGLQECATRAGVIHKCLSPYVLSLGKKTMGYMYCVKEIDYAKDGAVARYCEVLDSPPSSNCIWEGDVYKCYCQQEGCNGY